MSKIELTNRRSYSYRLRPFAIISMHDGSDTNDNQLVEPWRFDASAPYTDEKCVQYLIDRLDDLYKLGYKDFGIHMPVGKVETDLTVFYSVNQWTGMPTSRQDALVALQSWISDKRALTPDLSFALFTSIPARTDLDTSQVGLYDQNIFAPQPADVAADAAWLLAQVEGWISIGVDRLWLDMGADDANEYGGLGTTVNKAAQYQRPFYENLGLNTGYSNFPVDSNDFTLIRDDPDLGAASYICNNLFIDTYDKMIYDSFYFNYEVSTRKCSITTVIDDITGPTYTQGGSVAYWEEGDTIYIKSNNGFDGNYLIESVINSNSFKLSATQPFVSAGLPGTDVNGVLAEYTKRPGLTSVNWSTNTTINELAAGFFPSSGYPKKTMKEILGKGIRVGFWNYLETDFKDDAQYTANLVMDAYNEYLDAKITQRRIWKQN
jgi:hypothetical protein